MTVDLYRLNGNGWEPGRTGWDRSDGSREGEAARPEGRAERLRLDLLLSRESFRSYAGRAPGGADLCSKQSLTLSSGPGGLA